jgi:hypothetical protein
MDAIILIEYIITIAIGILAFRAGYKKFAPMLKLKQLKGKQLRVDIRGQIAAVRDPVLLYYRTNAELIGISVDVGLSASILRTRVQVWKTIVICGVVGFFCFMVGTGF